jgi:hypothetical protein
MQVLSPVTGVHLSGFGELDVGVGVGGGGGSTTIM